jgi:hypothetical protein
MPIQFESKVSSTARVQVSETPGADGSGSVFTLSKPTKSASFGRGALNVLSHLACFIPGLKYTKNTYNPRQWAAFKNAIVATYAAELKSAEGHLTEAKIDQILRTYSHHKRLTQGKASAVLADVQRVARGEPLLPRKQDRLNASQFAPGRGLRTLAVMIGGLNKREKALKREFAESSDQKAVAIRNILRPGRTMTNKSVSEGQKALARQAKQVGANFDWSAKGMEQMSLDSRLKIMELEESAMIETLRDAASKEPHKPALLSIPVILFPKTLGFHEQHVVELAVDFRHDKLLYLDSKGESIEQATANYDSGDIAQALRDFGQRIFAHKNWSPEQGIVQMTQAKQKGANDCGAFTHDFTRRLIGGQSVGDIERDFDADDRRVLRFGMAQDIAGPDRAVQDGASVPPGGGAPSVRPGSASWDLLEEKAVQEPGQQSEATHPNAQMPEQDESEFFDLKREQSGKT